MQADSDTGFAVDGRRMHVPVAWTGSLDVAFDGRRVFSFDPRRHPAQPDGYRIVSWPQQFRPFLTGRTTVSVSEHDGRTLTSTEIAFDDGEGRVSLVDDSGYDLAADKWGRLSRTFDSLGRSFGEDLLDDVSALIRDVGAVLGVPSFIAYGTLLGAVRQGDFIGHDTDADISYLSKFSHPADVAAEAFALRRGLQQRGWLTHASTTTFLQAWRGVDTPEEQRIDIFTAYFLGDHFAIDCWVRGTLTESDIVPLGEVTLAGRSMPAPAEPDALLEITYGPGWRTPDPAFKFAVPRSTSSRAFGYFGHPVVKEAISVEEALRPPGPDEPLRPSDFARWVAATASPEATVVDVRLGVGHDATWLSDQGRRVVAVDVKDNSRAHQVDRDALGGRLTFERLPLDDLRRTMARGAQLAGTPSPVVLTVSRLLEDLRPAARANLWVLVRLVLGHGGTLLLETADPDLAPLLERGVEGAGGHVVSRSSTVENADHAAAPTLRIRADWPTKG